MLKKRINRGVGYGMEIPVEYIFYCNEKAIQCAKKTLDGVDRNVNKNTLAGPASCKKTTRHYAHLSLHAKSRKTNDAKSKKWPKNSIWAIFLTISRSHISKLQIF